MSGSGDEEHLGEEAGDSGVVGHPVISFWQFETIGWTYFRPATATDADFYYRLLTDQM